jgi:DNA replication and repair protein RecF
MARLSQIRLRRFRNYTQLDLELPPGLTVLVGENGQGKTNILEAVYYLSLLRSFRTTQIAALHQAGTKGFFLGATVLAEDQRESTHTLGVGYSETRRIRRDGKQVRKASEFINAFLCVALVPEDIQLVKGPAAERRRFLDITLSQLDCSYLTHLQRYAAALRARNAMLKDTDRYGALAVTAYDHILTESGAALIHSRRKYVEFLAQRVEASPATHIAGDDAKLTLRYLSAVSRDLPDEASAGEIRAAFSEALSRSADRDRQEGYTRYGPHRDDLLILLGSSRLDGFGSEGQCRLAALSLRITAGHSLVAAAGTGRAVVLLVDDVLGELDRRRRERVLDLVCKAGQALLTCTEIPDCLPATPAAVFRVERGQVVRA